MIYNSYRIAPRSAVLGAFMQVGIDIFAGESSTLESYAGTILTTVLMKNYILNPTRLKNLIGVIVGAGGTQILEMLGGIQKFSASKIVYEMSIAGFVSLVASKLVYCIVDK